MKRKKKYRLRNKHIYVIKHIFVLDGFVYMF